MITFDSFVDYVNSNKVTLDKKLRDLVYVTTSPSLFVETSVSGTNSYIQFKEAKGSAIVFWEIITQRPMFSLKLIRSNISRALYDLERCIKPKEDETEEQFFLRAVSVFTDLFQKPQSRGCVKAYLDRLKVEWYWKRPDHHDVVEMDGEHFYAPTDSRFVRAHRSEEDSEWVTRNTDNITSIGGKFWFNDCLVPIYHNSIPFERIVRRVPTNLATQYEYILMDGERRYIDVRRSTNSLAEVPLHSYGTRIEQLVPVVKLFQKGKKDLYENRPPEETPFLGWELEAEVSPDQIAPASNAFKRYMPFQVMCKSDSSITPSGFETTSIPATLDFWKESDLESTLNSMRAAPFLMRSWNNKSCGFHVHVSRSALSVLDLQKMERFIHNPENSDFLISVAGRKPNTYQKFDKKLFEKRSDFIQSRKTRVQNANIDGLLYFNGIDACVEGANEYSELGISKHYNFLQFLSSNIQYESITNKLANSGCEELLENPCIVNKSIFSYLTHAISHDGNYSPTYSPMLTEHRPDLSTSSTQSDYVKRLTEYIAIYLSQTSDTFAFILYALNINWEGVKLVTSLPSKEEASSSSTIPSWKKILIRKTAANSSRKHSYNTAQSISGPVGKAVIGRYDALNTRNQSTVEFRLFKGTMNPTSVMRYLEFVDALVRFVPSTSASDEGVSFKQFVKWLVNDGFNITRYEHLVSFLKDKSWIDKSLIRRRTMPKVDSEDKSIIGFVPLKPKGFDDEKPAEPICSFSSTRPTTEETTLAPLAYDPEETEVPASEEEICSDCGSYYDYCIC